MQRILIIGAGYIGMEMADALTHLSLKVTSGVKGTLYEAEVSQPVPDGYRCRICLFASRPLHG